MIIWLIALAVCLFKSPFHICVRYTNGPPHALSSALLLFHARPWKHLPQLRHSFCSKGPTPSLSVDWWRHTPSDSRTPTHGLLSVLYSRHTTSSLHGDTRRLIRHTDPSRHTGNCCCCWLIYRRGLRLPLFQSTHDFSRRHTPDRRHTPI